MSKILTRHWIKRKLADNPANILSIRLNKDVKQEKCHMPYFKYDAHTRFLPTIRFKLRCGEDVSFPYKCLNLMHRIDDNIYFSIARKTVIIEGSHLDELYDWLGNYRVVWIRESDTGYNRDIGKVFVKRIYISEHIVQ